LKNHPEKGPKLFFQKILFKKVPSKQRTFSRKVRFTGSSPQTIHRKPFTARAIHRRSDSPQDNSTQEQFTATKYSPQDIHRKDDSPQGQFTTEAIHRKNNSPQKKVGQFAAVEGELM
jgi:hypothetical protein